MQVLVLLSLVVLLTRSVRFVSGAPREKYPFNEQYPPVARVGQSFSFQISPNTFESDSGDHLVKYEAYNLPEWLSWNSTSLILSGNVPKSFVDNTGVRYFNILLEGVDESDNAKLSVEYTLVATTRKGPSLSDNFNLLDALRQSGGAQQALTNGKDALKFSPGEPLNVVFNRDIFKVGDEPTLRYYGRSSQYHAPLPSWLGFDSGNMKFTGNAYVPASTIAPETSFKFSLIASDFEGYCGVEMTFNLLVGSHKLGTMQKNRLVVSAEKDGSFDYDIPLQYVSLDGRPIERNDNMTVSFADNNAPNWITLSDYKLVGKLPLPETDVFNLTLSIADTHGNVVYLDFSIQHTDKLFAIDSFPHLNATRGEWFEFELSQSQFTKLNDLNVNVTLSGNDWMKYDKDNMTLHGLVPEQFQQMVVEIQAERDGISEKLPLTVVGIKSQPLTITPSSSVGHTSTLQPSSSGQVQQTSVVTPAAPIQTIDASIPLTEQKRRLPVALICGIVIPLFLLIVIALLLLLLWRHRKKKNTEQANEKDLNFPSKHISSPKLGNPANNPNPFIGPAENASITSPTNEKFADPFTDSSSSSTFSMKKAGALNAVKSEGVNRSFSDEKAADDLVENIDFNEKACPKRNDSLYLSTNIDSNDPRSSSIYYNSEPSNRKSWRYSSHLSKGRDSENYDATATRSVSNKSHRESSASSVQTVSTADLLNTEVSISSDLPQTSQRSLNIVNSRDKNQNILLPTLEELEQTSRKNNHKQVPSSDSHQTSSSGISDFVPVKQGDVYQFTSKQPQSNLLGAPLSKKYSTKRLVKLENKGGVNVSDASLIGQEPERV